ncbi:MAG: sugar transferase [Candidatus Marinimicrobia bacterium]|nr:sugar transferase [Candidatus Neomarinimicrobiota bacterium]MDP6593667.1 sugar transferase [Candidatus Neomarinimicrobiota bacterium]|tara:strand:+ start:11 stop:1411 length:1401 start_codon:yes stop_codon:yes gene_type:complete
MLNLDFKRNYKYWLVVVTLLFVDGVAGWLAFSQTIYLHFAADFNATTVWLLFLLLQTVWVSLFYLNGRYRVDPTLSRFEEIQTLFKITLFIAVVSVIGNELFPVTEGIPSSAILQYWFFFIVCLTLGRLVVRQIQKILMRKGYGRKNTLVVGINERARRVALQLENGFHGYNLVGFMTPDENGDKTAVDEGPVLGSIKSLEEAIQRYHVSEVVIALEKPNHDKLLDIITIANGAPVSLKIIPDMYEVVSGLAKTEQIQGVSLVQIHPEVISFPGKILKRVIDIVIALLVLVPLSPVWVVFALAIKIDSRGPIFYRQERVGFEGRHFIAYKFRSMVKDAESMTGPVWARHDDPRVTRMGRFLRRFRLDEIPQFINALKGDMSVVGPRPERPYFVQKLMDEFPFYYRRHKMRPGITGWAQIKHSYDSSLDDVRQKLKYDFAYIENYSLTLDFLVMIRTVGVMFLGRGR